MRRYLTGICSLVVTASTLAAGGPVREVKTRTVAPEGSLPADLTSPEGKTRWHLEALALGSGATVAIAGQDQGFVQETRTVGQTAATRLAVSGGDAERWLLPDHDPLQMKMGAHVSLRFDETRDGLADRLIADVATVGIGWVHLPGEPKEAVLQRVLLSRQRAGERGMRPEALIHRWVSPLEGVIATISGPPTADGRSRLSVGSVQIVESVLSGASTLKLYADQLYRGTFTDLKYGVDRGPGVAVSAMVPDAGVNNVCDLVNLNTWNFSGDTVTSPNAKQTATTEAPSTLAESCNANGCGYAGYPVTGGLKTPILERFDRDLTGTLRKDNQVIQREDRATDVTFWLRAGSQNEGAPGSFGAGETRFCFTDVGATGRNEVPVWQMAHNDASGWYTQAGDTWSSVPMGATCEQSFYNCQCGSCGGLFQTLYARACTSSTPAQSYSGSQFTKVVKGGVVVLPSGHTVNALVLRNTTEFCTYTGSGCSGILTPVRTIVYIFQAPYVGAVALVRGPQTSTFTAAELAASAETPCTNVTSFDYTDISYGLLPPVSITAGATTSTTVALSWNPGNDVHRIAGYKIYWDTDSGGASPYAFNSVANAGQVAIVGTTATISGLTPGTTYYVTVTSLSDYTDPSTNVVTHYESIKYPTTVSGDPAFSYPIEVATATTAVVVPPKPVPDGSFGTAMRASRVDPSGSTIALTWDVATCTSADHHVLYGDLASVGSLTVLGAACDLGTTGSATWGSVPAGSLWFDVVGDDNATVEGSWGTDGHGVERRGATPSGQCGLVARNNSGTCP